MKLDEIIKIASKAYEPHETDMLLLIHEQYKEFMAGPDKKGRFRSDMGDTLADFIVIELHETYDPEVTDSEQMAEAARVIGSAADEIRRVAEALEDA